MQGVGPTEEVSDTAVAHAFAAFYRRHYGAVLAYAVRRIDDRETAREIAVDVFRIAWAAAGGGPEPTRAWLLRVARNQVGDAYRRRDRDRRLRRAGGGGAARRPTRARRAGRARCSTGCPRRPGRS